MDFLKKKKIKWFSVNELKNHKNFRFFYKEIIDILVDNEKMIKKLLN